MTFTTQMTGGDNDKAYSIKVGSGDGGLNRFTVGTLQSGRDQKKGSTTTVSIPLYFDKNGNAIFDNQKSTELNKKDKNTSTKE